MTHELGSRLLNDVWLTLSNALHESARQALPSSNRFWTTRTPVPSNAQTSYF